MLNSENGKQKIDSTSSTPRSEKMNKSSFKKRVPIATSFDSEVTLDNMLLKIRSFYDNLPPKTLGLYRIEFNEALAEVKQFFQSFQKKMQNKALEKENEIRITKKKKEIKIKSWKSRYEKLYLRWKECMYQLDKTHKEIDMQNKESFERLKNSKKGKEELISKIGSLNDKEYKQQRKLVRKYLSQNIFIPAIEEIQNLLNCEMCKLYISKKNGKSLKSIALVHCDLDLKDTKVQLPKERGFASFCFKNKRILNIENAYKDKRFYHKLDRFFKITTKSVLCIPIFRNTVSNDENPDGIGRLDVLGVIEVCNKQKIIPEEEKESDLKESDKTIIDFQESDIKKLQILSKVIGNFLNQVIWLFEGRSKEEEEEEEEKYGKNKEKKPVIYQKRKESFGKGLSTSQYSKKKQDIKLSASQPELYSIDQLKELVPKQVEDFVSKLNQCWKKAIKETTKLQSEIGILKASLEQKEKESSFLKNENTGLKSNLEKVTHRMKLNIREFKDKRMSWKREKEKMIEDVEKLKTFYLHFLRQSKIQIPFHLEKELTLDLGKEWRNKGTKISQKKENVEIDFSKAVVSMPPIGKRGIVTKKTHGRSLGLAIKKSKQARHSFSGRMKSKPKFQDMFQLSFDYSPIAMILLSNKFRIWRINKMFCELVQSKEEDILGIQFSQLAVGVDADNLKRLLSFDVVQGLGLTLPKITDIVKVTMQVKMIGTEGNKFQSMSNHYLKAPFYVLTFVKCLDDENVVPQTK